MQCKAPIMSLIQHWLGCIVSEDVHQSAVSVWHNGAPAAQPVGLHATSCLMISLTGPTPVLRFCSQINNRVQRDGVAMILVKA